MKRTMSKSLAKPQLFTMDEADGRHTYESLQMIGDGGDVETAFCNHPLAGGVSLKSRFGEHMKRLLMKHMKLGDVKDPGKHERGWMSAILKPFGGGRFSYLTMWTCLPKFNTTARNTTI